MKTYRLFLHCAVYTVLVAVGLVINTGTANAQQAGEVIEEIVEIGAPVVHREVKREGPIGMQVETITLRRTVSYADLDLSKHADVILLKNRIESSARASCEQLSDMVPVDRLHPHEIWSCTKRAVEGTDEAVAAAIATASG